jgi:general secretion pathway protein D
LRYVTGLETTTEIQLAVVSFFQAVGVNLAAPKSVFFNDRQGTLTVRATDEDLELIEQAINTLNIAPPEVTVKTRFVEVNQNDNKQLGFDWYLGNFLMNNKSIGASGGTQPSFQGAPSLANPEGTFPGSVLGGTATAPAASDGLLTGGLRNNNQNSAPAIFSMTGILTDPQFKVVLHAIDQRDGADLLNEGEVTTMSGRQANFQVIDVVTIVTGAPAGSTGGGNTTPTAGLGGNVVQNQATAINYTLDTEPYGTTLDVVPYVCADGYTIQMTLIPTITEFIGYDNPGNFVPTVQSGSGGIPITGQLPLPRSRVRQVVTSCTVWDGQTVVLGGLITENVQRQKDKVPVLGDLPAVGRLFRSEQNITQRKNLVVFVTPTIIDPSGNRKNLDGDMPFARAQLQTPMQSR